MIFVMYNDILGEKKKDDEHPVTKDSIISAQKANIEAKEKYIKDLVKKITELERQIESYERI